MQNNFFLHYNSYVWVLQIWIPFVTRTNQRLYKPFGLLVPTCFMLICFLFVLDNNHYYFPLTGIYVCSNCGNELFHSQTKYEHSSPWPAFTHLIREDSVTRVKESSTAIKVLLWWFCKPFSKFYNMCVLYYK